MPQNDEPGSVAEPATNEQTAFLNTEPRDPLSDEFGVAISSAVVEEAPPEVFVDLAYMTPEALDLLVLPECYSLTGFRPDEILIEREGLTFTFNARQLDFSAPDWGIVLPSN